MLVDHPLFDKAGILAGMNALDGYWYGHIAANGYFFDPNGPSSIVFFPSYPLLGRAVMVLSRLSPQVALLVVSNACFLAALIFFDRYLRRDSEDRSRIRTYALLSLALFPVSFFFRMAYTESLFLLLTILAMYGIRYQWPMICIALIIGLATATRAVGVALLAPFFLHLWRQSTGKMLRTGVFQALLPRALVLFPLALSGLIGFMLYQARTFKNPLAFSQAQSAWHMRDAASGVLPRLRDLITLEPIRSVYTPSSPCYWGNGKPPNEPFLGLQFANPIFFLVVAGLIALGTYMRWLTLPEVALGLLLLLIPYVLQSGRMCMTSQARFTSIIFPAYIVLGHLLWRLPKLVSVYLLISSAILLAIYSMFFSLWYWFF